MRRVHFLDCAIRIFPLFGDQRGVAEDHESRRSPFGEMKIEAQIFIRYRESVLNTLVFLEHSFILFLQSLGDLNRAVPRCYLQPLTHFGLLQ